MKKVIWKDVDRVDDALCSDITDLVWTLLTEEGKDLKNISFDIVVRYEERK